MQTDDVFHCSDSTNNNHLKFPPNPLLLAKA